jgi:subfamily B ATP-binding cassette protein MsbA
MVRKYLRPYWGTLLLLFLVYAAFTLLTAIQPVILAPVLDIALNGGQLPEATSGQQLDISSMDLNNLGQFIISSLGLAAYSPWTIVVVLAFAYLIAALLVAAFNFANYVLAQKIKIAAGRDIQVDLFRHLFDLSLDFFHNQKMGELIARLDQDTKASITGLELALRNLLVSPLLILYFGYLMVKTNANLTLFVVAAGIFHYILTQILRNPIRKRMFEQFNVAAEVTAFLQERLAGARVVKTFVAEAYEVSRLRKMVDEVMDVNIRYGLLKHVDEPVTAGINALINVGILLFTANELFAGRLSTSGFFLYLYVGRAVLGPLTSLTQTFNSLQSTLAAGIRVRELFSIKPSVVSGTRHVNQISKGIQFEGVSFSYPGTPVLESIELLIPKGSTTALVGPSGGGKSTLADLVLRFYDPQKGRVLLDGQDLRDFVLSDYRKLFGFVAQENILFNATVAENIAYARPEITKQAIEEAATIANAMEFIHELPKGFDTFVGDRGVRLSGGQRQRIAIARAIAHRPQILVLDEATSSLDTEAEKRVQVAVDQAIQSTTAIVIAHRLSTVIRADKIVVLENGHIIDMGKHEELLARCTLYQRLASLQFADMGMNGLL